MIAPPSHVRLAWRLLARRWASIGPPFRPSPADLAVYREHLGALRGDRILLLGSTPELRDLAASLGIASVTLVDMDRTVAAAMDRFVTTADRRHETLVVDDWSRMEFPAGSFGAVVGDLVWHWIRASRRAVVRDRIERFLRPGGLFISRFRLIPDVDPDRLALRHPRSALNALHMLLHVTVGRALLPSVNANQTRADILALFEAGFTLVDEARPGAHPILVFRRHGGLRAPPIPPIAASGRPGIAGAPLETTRPSPSTVRAGQSVKPG